MSRDYEKLLRVKMLLFKVETLLSETSGEIITPEEKKVLINSIENSIQFLEQRCESFNKGRWFSYMDVERVWYKLV